MAMLPVPLQTETRPSDGLAMTWVGVSGAIRYGLIIGVQGVPMPDLDVIMRGQTKQFAIVGIPARFTGVVDIGTPAGATRQFGLVAYRSDGGIFPISPLTIFPARSAPRDREYHAVVPPALVEVAPTQQSAQPVKAADPSDPWSVLEAASNAAPTPATPTTFTAPQPATEVPSFTISQPSPAPTVPHTPAPYDPWDVLSQGSAAADDEPVAEPIEEEASAPDWAEPTSFTEPTPSYAAYREEPSQALPVELEQRDEPPSETIADKVVPPIKEPAWSVVEPADAFPEPVQFEPYRPAVAREPEPQPVDIRPVNVEPVTTTAPAEAGPVEHDVPAPLVSEEAAHHTSPDREYSPEPWTSVGTDLEPAPVTPLESKVEQAVPDVAIDADRPSTADRVGDKPEALSISDRDEPAPTTAVADVAPSMVSEAPESQAPGAGSPTDEPSSAPIADDSGERMAVPASHDVEYQTVESAATSTPTDRDDRAAVPGAPHSWELPVTPVVAAKDDHQEPSIPAESEKETATPTIFQTQPTTPDVSPAWMPVEGSLLSVEPVSTETEPLSVHPAAESEGSAVTESVTAVAPTETRPAAEPTPLVDARTEAPAPRIAEPAPIEAEPEPPAPPLPADLGALLDEAELYLLPQWADSDAALSLVEQVEREAPGHPRTRAVRARIESMRSMGAAGSEQGDSTQIAGLLEKAGRSMNDRDYWGAVDYYEQVLAEKPEHDEAREGLRKARLRARWPSQLTGAGSDVAALRALGNETVGEAPDLAGQAYAAAFAIQPSPDLLRLRLSAFAHAGYTDVLTDTARRAVQVLEENGRILPNPSVTAALEALQQTAGTGGTETEAAINRLCEELAGAGQ